MFLTRGPMPHERVWTRWLSGLADLLPAAITCSPRLSACFAQHKMPETKNVIHDAQHFYSIYIHHKPSFKGYPPDSIFHGRQTQRMVEVRQACCWNSYNDWSLIHQAKGEVAVPNNLPELASDMRWLAGQIALWFPAECLACSKLHDGFSHGMLQYVSHMCRMFQCPAYVSLRHKNKQ